MAGRSENDEGVTEVTFTRCIKCDLTVMTHATPTRRLVHLEDGSHAWRDWMPAAEGPRPDHRTVSMFRDVRAAVLHIMQAQYQLGHLPDKPEACDADEVRLQLADARAVLGVLELALTDGSAS